MITPPAAYRHGCHTFLETEDHLVEAQGHHPNVHSHQDECQQRGLRWTHILFVRHSILSFKDKPTVQGDSNAQHCAELEFIFEVLGICIGLDMPHEEGKRDDEACCQLGGCLWLDKDDQTCPTPQSHIGVEEWSAHSSEGICGAA